MIRRVAQASAAGFLAIAVLSACDLPADAESARDRLARGQERIVPIELALPLIAIDLRERLTDAAGTFSLGNLLDSATLRLDVPVGSLAVPMGEHLAFDAVELPAVTVSFDPAFADFRQESHIAVDPVPVTLPEQSTTAALSASGPGQVDLPLDFADAYGTAEFGPDSYFGVALTTSGTASLTGVGARIRDPSGTVLGVAPGTIDLGPGESDTLVIDVGGVTLPAAFILELPFASSTGDGAIGSLAVGVGFVDATVTAATDVDAARIAPIQVEQRVILDAAGSDDLSEAVLASGTLRLVTVDLGTLDFTPSSEFETDLAGKRIGGADPADVLVAGTLAPPAGADRADIETVGQVEVEITEIIVASAVLRQVAFQVDHEFDVFIHGSQYGGVDQILVGSGALVLDITNRLAAGGELIVDLAGTVGPDGQPIRRRVPMPPAPSGGERVESVLIDLAGAIIHPADLTAAASGTLTGTDVSVTQQSMAQALQSDPTVTPLHAASVTVAGASDLRFAVEHVHPVTRDDLNLGDANEEVLRNIRLTAANIVLGMTNPAAIDLAFDTLTLALVELENGQAVPVLDETGAAVIVRVPAIVVPAHGTAIRSAAGSSLVNELLDAVLDDGREVAIQASGFAGFGESAGAIGSGDTLRVDLDLRGPLRFTLTADGVVLDHIEPSFIDLDSAVAGFVADMGEALVRADVHLGIDNASPLGLELRLALAPAAEPGAPQRFRPFSDPTALILGDPVPIRVDAARVNANGQVTEPVSTTTTLAVPTDRLAVFRHGHLGFGLELRLLPPDGEIVELTPADTIQVRPVLDLRISTLGRRNGS